MPGDGKKPESPSAPGWYPDPWSATGSGERYFDGKGWGTAERPRGRHSAHEPRPRSSGAPRSRLSRVRPILFIAALVVISVVLVQYRPGSGSSDAPGEAAVAAGRVPPASTEESARPLGTPLPAPAGSGGYEFLEHQPDDAKAPVAFDPCRPVHYVVNPAGAPADGQQLIADAIARLGEATGLRFVADGATTEAPSKQRTAYQPRRYDPSRWAPVLIAWADERSYPSLAGYIAGIGGPRPWSTSSGHLAYVSGEIVLDGVQLGADAVPDRGAVRAVILHELGHLVGLDHTADRTQLMYSEAEFNLRDYGPGDRRGLVLLGTQACVPEL